MQVKFELDHQAFSAQLAVELITGGLTVIDAIEKLLSEWFEKSVLDSLKVLLIKAPRGVVHPSYYKNRFQNLAILSQEGYAACYSEVRFSTVKNNNAVLADIKIRGVEVDELFYELGPYVYKQKELKTQINHTIRINEITIPPEVFKNVLDEVRDKISQPYIANLTNGCDPIEFRAEGFQTVSFDHVITG